MRNYSYFLKYRKSNLTQLSAAIPKEMAEAFKDKLKKDNMSFAEFLKSAINLYMKEDKKKDE